MSRLLLLLLAIPLNAQILNFPWPLAPQNEQHRISSTFDECRADRDHFHNGIDIPLAEGNEVLAIMGGQVLSRDPNGINSYIRVEDFAYVHVVPVNNLTPGTQVEQGDVIGWTNNQNHIHLTYGGGASGHTTTNALLPNRITPFSDPYKPKHNPPISFVVDGTFNAFPGNALSGRVDIIAETVDTTDTQSSIDLNNGIYEVGWALYSADTSEVLAGPSIWFHGNTLYPNSVINNVYAPGSSTSIYRYIITNRISSNGYLNCDLYTPGPYVIAVMSADTRNNWDTTYVPITINEEDHSPPAQPQLEYVGRDADGRMRIQWTPVNDDDLVGYRLYFSFDGVNWSTNHGPEILTPTTDHYTFTYPEGNYLAFKVKALDGAPIPNSSELSDAYGVRLRSDGPQILIVDGFDRLDGSWVAPQHDFSLSYGYAIHDGVFDAGISSASNEWVAATGDLSNYDAVIWFLGDESRIDETLDAAEQVVLTEYLNGGGNLFISGSEIAYDLAFGDSADQAFLNEILNVTYAGDGSNSLAVQGMPPFFDEVELGYGTEPYEEDWPDHFGEDDSSTIALRYGNDLVAGIQNVTPEYSSLTIGFPFETVDSPEERTLLMDHALAFLLDSPLAIESTVPEVLALGPAYPNPFNARVGLPISLSTDASLTLEVVDVQGRMVFSEVKGPFQAGNHLLYWSACDGHGHRVASGIYLMRVQDDHHILGTRQVTVIK